MKNTIIKIIICTLTLSIYAESLEFDSIYSVEGILKDNEKQQRDSVLKWLVSSKKSLKENYGLSLGVDNFTHYLDSNSDQDPSDAASNVFRLYGTWTLIGKGTPNDGALIFKVESRDAIGNNLSTQALGPTLGYAGTFASTYSDKGWVYTNFYWKQHFADGKGGVVFGQVDVYDYVNVNSIGSPWTGFTNLAFQHQPTFPGPPQGLGAAASYHFNSNWSVLAGFVNANNDPHKPIESAKKLFDEGETFKHIAVGWLPKWAARFDRSLQFTFWQVDKREKAGVESGSGFSFLMSTIRGKWTPFLRAGYADGGGAMLDRDISVGTGLKLRDEKDLAGLGIGWGRAPYNDRDQYTLEAFYRYGVKSFMQLSPSIQYISKPANDLSTDDIFVIGARLRVFF
ncbi:MULTISPECIES: carbohydrate porin [unclassified Halobacteriovorax]|uniref:carbohydrate porin n=1 Tax=unclassified Halobacteriovorax TaxID=2639665 RepID=UPI00399BC07A